MSASKNATISTPSLRDDRILPFTRVLAAVVTAILAGKPVGWVSLGPREDYPRLNRSPIMKALDEKPVWSVVCFFVDGGARGRGVARGLLDGAIAHARSQGAALLEAYPIDKPRIAEESTWFGPKKIFDRVRFREMARRTPTRPLMRRRLQPKRNSPH
jgi:GNAT superfamily N-acetyltransferase